MVEGRGGRMGGVGDMFRDISFLKIKKTLVSPRLRRSKFCFCG